MTRSAEFRFSIDRGGTFTDLYAEVPGEPGFRVVKLLSENPEQYSDPALEGIRRVVSEVTGLPWSDRDPAGIDWVRMGTTVATNALLEKTGARVALLISRGFGDLLAIGKQNRPRLFDLDIRKPPPIYETVVEVHERVRLLRPEEAPDSATCRRGITGEYVEILQAPDLDRVRRELEALKARGITSVAIVLMHSYVFRDHEESLGALARDLEFDHVALSSQVMPRVKIVERGQTCTVDAYLTPKIRDYLQRFRAGFGGKEPELLFMQSDGGLVPADRFSGSNAILSGPAGGVVGYAATAWSPEENIPVIGFDMGGTSTDVSRYDGTFDWVQESEVAGVHLQAPQLNIHTVAAGGGSRLFYQGGLFRVGPESSGAHPGPVCYRKGGWLSVTDANLVLGRIHPDFFPKIFGIEQNLTLDVKATQAAFLPLLQEINQSLHQRGRPALTLEDTALGFVQVANAQMARAIEEVTVTRGYDVRRHILACFGGAGGQHACALARTLGIPKVRIHRFAGILSAYGLGLADVVRERQEPAAVPLTQDRLPGLRQRLEALADQARRDLQTAGVPDGQIQVVRFLHLRYTGTDHGLMVSESERLSFEQSFRTAYRREFGFDLEDRPIRVDEVRVRAVGQAPGLKPQPIPARSGPLEPVTRSQCWFEGGWQNIPVYEHAGLGAGDVLPGPALIIQDTSTIVVEPGCTARVNRFGDLEIQVGASTPPALSADFDPVQLAIFGNRFMSIAEQMGYALQRTAVSTNIKERQDFSCALFSPEGDLVANAPHQPVHLGSMGEAVKAQLQLLGGDWREGEVLLSNHPAGGGTHLPDLTVITPVFEQGRPAFFVASRGHHADIGSIAPGSMPPFATRLDEEGAAIRSFKLIEGGVFQEAGIASLLAGSRALSDNLSDLKAQVAANQRGIDLLRELVRTHSLAVVHAYMRHLQDCAAGAVSETLRTLAGSVNPILEAEDFLDDGTPLRLRLTLDPAGTAIFDFSGTGPEVKGNLNAPLAVTHSAVLYCLRCLVGGDLPLNQGCLRPIEFCIPQGSVLHPSEEAAVAAGNVLTSQRIVDLVFKAVQAAAASQGCMNNLTFGDSHFGYYETIGGGAGAGPGWHGASGVHTHMTNTRITDPEILEKRYPVRLREFSIRRGSGGGGRFHGGDGLVREIEFLQPMQVSILSERRVVAPYGLKGGAPGMKGVNTRIRPDGSTEDLGGKSEIRVEPGDRIRIETPGGGGYGVPD